MFKKNQISSTATNLQPYNLQA